MSLDTLTHAISGALLARATAPEPRTNTPSLRARTWIGFLTAAAPDIDAVMVLLGPVAYLSNHRGETHSLLLMPLWAWLLALAFSWVGGRRYHWKACYGICLMALGIHIVGDLITSYGTRILAPVSDWAPGLNSTFIIDPWFSGILLAGLLLSLSRGAPRAVAGATLAAITAVVLFQYTQYRSAVSLAESFAEERGLKADEMEAYPQPLSWFNWGLAVVSGETYYHTRVNLLADQPRPEFGEDAKWLVRLWADYQPVDHARWTRYRKFGDGTADVLARTVWAQDELAFYRRFAQLPLVYRAENSNDETCVWFYDLRFALAELTPPFRYGMCRPPNEHGDWELYRLTADGRQAV